jgi:hypothetical protein
MKRAIGFLKKEKSWFVLISFLSLTDFFFVRYIPSLDGPQHLYSVNLLVNILKGNQAVQEYFMVNPLVVGYWSGHFILGFFHLFLPAFLAEKMLIVAYLLGIYFSFRYLVTSLNKTPSFVTFLIFPFALNTYLLYGYYNFCLAIIVFFLFFGFWIRNKDKLNVRNFIILLSLFLLTFLSHAFVFAVMGVVLGFFLLFDFTGDLLNKKGFRGSLYSLFRQTGFLFLAAIPSIILWIIYIRAVMGISDEVATELYSLKERFKFLFMIKPLVGFSQSRESLPNIAFFIIVCFLLIYKFVQLIKNSSKNPWSETLMDIVAEKRNRWGVLGIVLLIIYFLIPDKISAGNLTNRIGILFFYALIVWLAQKAYPKWVQWVAVTPLFLFFIYQKIWHFNPYQDYNIDITEIMEAGEMMEPNCSYYPIRISENWMSVHFLCYPGVDKPLINIQAPQSDGQFPVTWNRYKIPLNYVGNERSDFGLSQRYEGTTPRRIQIADYVLIYHERPDISEFRLDNNTGNILNTFYSHCFTSSQGRVKLFRFSAGCQIDSIKEELERHPSADLEMWKKEAEDKKINYNDFLTILALDEYAARK